MNKLKQALFILIGIVGGLVGLYGLTVIRSPNPDPFWNGLEMAAGSTMILFSVWNLWANFSKVIHIGIAIVGGIAFVVSLIGLFQVMQLETGPRIVVVIQVLTTCGLFLVPIVKWGNSL